jgi:hypothetical protein
METTTKQTAQQATISALRDSAAFLRMLLDDVEQREFEASGPVRIDWNDAGDAIRMRDELLDIAQRLHYGDVDMANDGEAEKKVREMAIQTARTKFQG